MKTSAGAHTLDVPDADRLDATPSRSELQAHIAPNLFTTVMGTGIVATSAATLPIQAPGLHTLATAVWVLACIALVVVTAAFIAQWTLHRDTARGHLNDPLMSHFYGAPAMAVMTVGAGTLLFGSEFIGRTAAVVVDATLWSIGTAIGLVAIGFVTTRLITRSDRGGVPVPARMMSVVAPMVSASTGALLIPEFADELVRLVLLTSCYVLFTIGLVFGTATAFFVYRRLILVGLPARAASPTVWIPLGMVGQSITAAITLGSECRGEFSGSTANVADALHTAGTVYGIAVGLVGLAVAATAVSITVHVARRGLPFSFTWWSFTFPIGTCVTGATALGTTTGSGEIHAVAVMLYVVLFTVWAIVVTRTVGGIFGTRAMLW